MAKFVIFTPTHHDRYIMEAYESLKRQTCTDWKWVVVPNGKATVPDPIRQDPRVTVLPWPEHMQTIYATNIGGLKGFACNYAVHNNLGEILVELDHDDYLTDHALQCVADEHRKHPDVGFFHSDCVGFDEQGNSEVFDAVWGWEQYPVTVNGKRWTAMKSFPVNARTLYEIYFCPNHIRCWTVDAYVKSGGHAPSMKVIDDHDLLCRTYLAGVKFYHIEDALYMYRRHSDATTAHDNTLIQTQQKEVGALYQLPLIKEWCRREGLQMYDLGAAHNPAPGFIGVDLCNAKVIHDVTFGQWAPDNSAGAIRCADFIEHIPIPEIVPFVNNVYKQLAPGGWWLTSTPSTDGRGAFCDPTHVSFWNELSFRYYTDANYARYVPAIRSRFQQVKLYTHYPSKWHEQHNVPYVVSDMCALKGQRQPGFKAW